MPIPLDPRIHVVTQQAVWDNQKLGVLTDRRIEHYIKEGYYGKVAKQRLEQRKKNKQRARDSGRTLDQLIKKFSIAGL